MKMSDKEFDQLFNAKLTDLEMEPSAALWGKIVPQIPGNSKSGLAPMLGIAATLVILFTAGLLFMPRTQKVVLRGTYDPQQTINDAVAAATHQQSAVNADTAITVEQPVVEQAPVTAMVKHPAVNKKANISAATTTITQVDTLPLAITLTKPVNITRIDHQDNNVNKPVIPVTNTLANATFKTDQPVNQVRSVAANNAPATKTPGAVKKKKIHNLGDLLNVVIAKVDKRDNKIIQFGRDDDDDDDDLLNVTGVNLGPIKVKKQN